MLLEYLALLRQNELLVLDRGYAWVVQPFAAIGPRNWMAGVAWTHEVG